MHIKEIVEALCYIVLCIGLILVCIRASKSRWTLVLLIPLVISTAVVVVKDYLVAAGLSANNRGLVQTAEYTPYVSALIVLLAIFAARKLYLKK